MTNVREIIILVKPDAPMVVIELPPSVGNCQLRPDGGWSVTIPRSVLEDSDVLQSEDTMEVQRG